MNWFGAMLCLLPAIAMDSRVQLFKVRVPSGQKGRTWLVMFCASLAAWLLRAYHPAPDYNPSPAYAVIDAISAFFVLRRPLGEMQRAIGILFIGMLGVDLGFTGACWLQPGPHDFGGYFSFNTSLGWLQWACLAWWGIGDALAGFLVRIGWSGRDAAPHWDGA